MKLLLPIAMLFFGAPLLAQPQVLIDNRTDHDVDTARVRRLTVEAVADAPVSEPTIFVHIWPRKALQTLAGRKTPFFVGPNHVFMYEVDYLALIHGVLLVAFPGESSDNLGTWGRRIWLTDQLVVRVDTLTAASTSPQ